ncbi:hypothetical protein ACFE04_006829 [Oxalis oulophora]
MQSLQRLRSKSPALNITSSIINPKPPLVVNYLLHHFLFFSTTTSKKSDNNEWNDAWETAWLPDDLNPKTHQRAPWETDVNNNNFTTATIPEEEADADTKAFLEDMNENWDARRNSKSSIKNVNANANASGGLYSLDNMKNDYRVKKQRMHASLWTKEIEKMDEANLHTNHDNDDIDRLLGTCSEIFDSTNNDLENAKIPTSSEFKNKPDGWETTSKEHDGNVWEMTQREEDILLQEFDRRTAYCKFQIASFIKTHIFSRRRPIDGWKHMIEEIGPNARKGKGSVARVPSLSDASTQPFKEEKTPIGGRLTQRRQR